jgi:hypothetical protein
MSGKLVVAQSSHRLAKGLKNLKPFKNRLDHQPIFKAKKV